MTPDDLEQLECRLKRIPLRRPPADLDERMASLFAPRPVRASRRWTVAAVAAVAAAACLALALGPRLWSGRDEARAPGEAQPPPAAARDRGPAHSEPRADPPPAPPVRIDRVWAADASRGVVFSAEAEPVERFERRIVRQVVVIDEDRQRRIEWHIPTKQTVDLPLEYN